MNPSCPRCGTAHSVKAGRYHRFDDAQSIQRYRCPRCAKTYSSATFTPTYRQKRRRLNRLIEMDIASSTAQRRIAIKHGCDKKTVARKVVFLAQEARKKTAAWLASCEPFTDVQWDEMLSFEHTRLKPLSIAVMVCVRSRRILGYGIAPVPASGLIAKRSREKYGKRPDRSGPCGVGCSKVSHPVSLTGYGSSRMNTPGIDRRSKSSCLIRRFSNTGLFADR